MDLRPRRTRTTTPATTSSTRPACSPTLAPRATCPTVGFTAYGGLGDDLIIGSQAGDHLAGGSGDDEIRGLRGVDHIYGDSGVNVDVLTRALDIATINRSPLPTVTGAGVHQRTARRIEPLPASPASSTTCWSPAATCSTARAPGPASARSPCTPAQPESAYDDIIFGDHGAVDPERRRPERARRPPAEDPDHRDSGRRSARRSAAAATSQRGADDVIFGGLGRDVLVGGAGNDMVDGDEAGRHRLRRQRRARPDARRLDERALPDPVRHAALQPQRHRPRPERSAPAPTRCRPRTTRACCSSTAPRAPTATPTARRGGPSTTSRTSSTTSRPTGHQVGRQLRQRLPRGRRRRTT